MTFLTSVPWQSILLMYIVYLASLVIYRLFYHPLARFPGPKLAAATRYFEAYFDIVQNGQYTFRIAEMHRTYGPIIRMSPHELHVADRAFFEVLYRQDGRWDKYSWTYDAFSAKGAIICSTDHDVHRARRLPLNSFFSKSKVALRHDLIQRNVEKLCARIFDFAESQTSFHLGAALSAFTRDVSTEFIIGKSYESLESPDFNIGMTNVFQDSGHIWRLTKHIRWFGPTMKSIPVDWIMKIADEGTKRFFRYLQETEVDTKELMTLATTSSNDSERSRTIVDEILISKLPPSDKAFERVFDDVATVTGAGFETTAGVLRLISFHVFNSPDILRQARTEIASIPLQPDDAGYLRALEQLPYLTAILMEGLRLSPAIASRMARIAPARDLFYKEWCIPADTPVGMTSLLLHTDSQQYPDPMRFNPDRWLPSSGMRPDKSYAPFSRGTRNCLGMHLAWAEMYLVVAALVLRFDFDFDGASAKDFECESDQFILGTRGKGTLKAFPRCLKV